MLLESSQQTETTPGSGVVIIVISHGAAELATLMVHMVANSVSDRKEHLVTAAKVAVVWTQAARLIIDAKGCV